VIFIDFRSIGAYQEYMATFYTSYKHKTQRGAC